MPCHARVQLQIENELTAAKLERAVADVADGYGRLTNICHKLSSMTKPVNSSAASEQSGKELHVFCNPLFGAT